MYTCINCGYKTHDADNLPLAQDIHMRLEPGDIYTDRECPACGALCFPEESLRYSYRERLVINAAVRAALADAEIFDELAEEYEMSDELMILLREKLNED